jgi:hypothetical protein
MFSSDEWTTSQWDSEDEWKDIYKNFLEKETWSREEAIIKVVKPLVKVL